MGKCILSLSLFLSEFWRRLGQREVCFCEIFPPLRFQLTLNSGILGEGKCFGVLYIKGPVLSHNLKSASIFCDFTKIFLPQTGK